MYSLELLCRPDEVDQLSAELWGAGTAGIRELDQENGHVRLVAGFETAKQLNSLLDRFRHRQPHWWQEAATDWVEEAQKSWPGKRVGSHFWLVPPWNAEPIPVGRIRLVHNPGLACGTGEHPCTQLALHALETVVVEGGRVVDVGTGSGILLVAALQLGAEIAIGLDTDLSALPVALDNGLLNNLKLVVAAGSTEVIRSAWADVTVANISGTVLLAILDDLLRITRRGGTLVLTGFAESEAPTFANALPDATVSTMDGWSCVVGKIELA